MSDRDFSFQDEAYREAVADWLDERDAEWDERPTRAEADRDEEDERR